MPCFFEGNFDKRIIYIWLPSIITYMEQSLEEIRQQTDWLFTEKRYQEAIFLLTDTILEKYSSAALYRRRALAFTLLGDWQSGLTDAEKSIALEPGLPLSYFSRGNIWYRQKQYGNAIEDYNSAIDIDDRYIAAFYFRGLSFYYIKQYDKAIADFTTVMDIDKKYRKVCYQRGAVWSKQGQYEKAIADYSEAIAIDVKDMKAYYNRGVSWSRKMMHWEAIDDYSRAIDLNEKNKQAYYNRAIAKRWLGMHRDAIDDYTKAIELDKEYKIAFNNRGVAQMQMNESEKAIDDFSAAIQLDEQYPNPYYNRALANSKLGRYDKAISDYTQYIALRNDPEHFLVKTSLSAIVQLEKKLANTWYDKIDILINDIKKLLLFEEPCITHYTSLSGAKAMLLGKSPFRLSEGAFLNDTSEGRVLHKYLSYDIAKLANDDTIALPFVEKPFIGSFVAETKHDDLTLWRMYGKEAQFEAKGCALTIYKDLLVNNIKESLSKVRGEMENAAAGEEQFTFYKVAYHDKNEFIVPGSQPAVSRQLNENMTSLKKEIANLDEEQKKEVAKILNNIAYLFKSAEYQHEYEVRLVVQGDGFAKKIDINTTPPKVFIEMVEIAPVLHVITLGPKVERADEWAAAFNYFIKKEYPPRSENVDIVISHLPYK